MTGRYATSAAKEASFEPSFSRRADKDKKTASPIAMEKSVPGQKRVGLTSDSVERCYLVSGPRHGHMMKFAPALRCFQTAKEAF